MKRQVFAQMPTGLLAIHVAYVPGRVLAVTSVLVLLLSRVIVMMPIGVGVP